MSGLATGVHRERMRYPHEPRGGLGASEEAGVTLVHFLTSRVAASDPPQTSYRHRVFYVGSDELSLHESGRSVEYLPLSLRTSPACSRTGRSRSTSR